jgi:hypothetical protein
VPNPLTGVLLAGTAYADAATIQDVFNPNGGSFLIVGGSVVYSLQYGRLGESFWTQDVQSVPGGGVIPKDATGVKFKNLSAALPATVSAVIAQGDEPSLALTFAGAVTGTFITGRVSSAGAIVGGTGFSVVFGGVNTYAITFTTAFAATPVVLVQIRNATGDTSPSVSLDTAGGFTVTFSGARDFDFVASAVA